MRAWTWNQAKGLPLKLTHIEIENFRCFESFSLDLGGDTALVIAPNGGGKTSLLEAIAKGSGLSRTASREDFFDLRTPIEIVLTIAGIPTEAAGIFADQTQFGGGPPTIKIGMRATWDGEEQELEVVHGFPDSGWTRATRAQRDALSVLWLPAHRDPTRSLQIVGSTSVLAKLVATLPLDQPLETAADTLDQAAGDLAAAQPLTDLLRAAEGELGQILPDATVGDFQFTPGATTDDDLLRQLELLLSGGAAGTAIPISRQSSGLAQLALFAFGLRALVDQRPDVLLLLDEPELSLHPHAQRALASRLREEAGQALIATHSSNILDRADPRHVVRLKETANGVQPATAGAITDAEAARLMRISDPRTAEAFFARRAIMVEGESDHVAVRALADRLGRNLDSEGISLISLEGAGSFGAFFTLLGPAGLDIPLGGLCDADHESAWRQVLIDAGLALADATAMANAGFFVCQADLEDEFFNALGVAGVEAALRAAGDGSAYDSFAAQPTQTGSNEEILRRYVDKHKVRSAPALVDALTLDANVPGPLNDLLAHA